MFVCVCVQKQWCRDKAEYGLNATEDLLAVFLCILNPGYLHSVLRDQTALSLIFGHFC